MHVAVLIIAAGIQLDALPKHILSFYHSPTLQEHAEADDFLLQGGAPPPVLFVGIRYGSCWSGIRYI